MNNYLSNKRLKSQTTSLNMNSQRFRTSKDPETIKKIEKLNDKIHKLSTSMHNLYYSEDHNERQRGSEMMSEHSALCDELARLN